jgi:hypothetical protein
MINIIYKIYIFCYTSLPIKRRLLMILMRYCIVDFCFCAFFVSRCVFCVAAFFVPVRFLCLCAFFISVRFLFLCTFFVSLGRYKSFLQMKFDVISGGTKAFCAQVLKSKDLIVHRYDPVEIV